MIDVLYDMETQDTELEILVQNLKIALGENDESTKRRNETNGW